MSGLGAPSRTATPMPVRPIAVHEPWAPGPCRVLSCIASGVMIATSAGAPSASFALTTPTVPNVSFTVLPVSFSNAPARSVTIERMAPALSTCSSGAWASAALVESATTSKTAQSVLVFDRPIAIVLLILGILGRASEQPVELARILARDLVRDVGRQMAELLLDVFRGLGPHAVTVRVVGAPHQRLDAHIFDELGADVVELEGALALPAPVVARLHREAKVAEAILPLEVHPVERVGDPADPALAERDADVGIALEHRGADHGGQDVDEVHLEAGDHREEGGAAREPALRVELARRQRRERVEVERQVHVVHGLPERLPDRMPHRLHVPRARELHPAQAELRHAVDLLHGRVDVAVWQAGQADVAFGIVAAEGFQPVVVDPEHLVGGLRIVEPRRGAEDAVDHLGLDPVAVHVFHAQRGIGGPADALLAVLVEPGR